MKAKLIVEGREFPIEIQDSELEKLLKSKKKTGYERVEELDSYYYVDSVSCVNMVREHNQYADDTLYESANYYPDSTVAENNASADKLMCQLRRFAVEHRENKIDWYPTAENKSKYYIYYDYSSDTLRIEQKNWTRHLFNVYFDSKLKADLAIETFHDELIWYFTEYKDSL